MVHLTAGGINTELKQVELFPILIICYKIKSITTALYAALQHRDPLRTEPSEQVTYTSQAPRTELISHIQLFFSESLSTQS